VTTDIAIVLGILLVAIILFISERVRVDLIALLVLGALALTGLVTPSEALSGFSSPAVVTVWAMFILSAGLAKTGVASAIGRQMIRVAGKGEARLMLVIMLTAGVMSAFMNNVGVAALLLPVVIDVARRTERPPSRMLMPLAIGCLLGGMTTLIGTPPNILASDALREAGLEPFDIFDYAPVGIILTLVGVAFVILVGRHLLPKRDPGREFGAATRKDLGRVFDLQEQLSVIRLPDETPLAGKTLVESRLGSALGLNVIGILHNGHTQLAPDTNTRLQPGDRLVVAGHLDRLQELVGHQNIELEDESITVEKLISPDIDIVEIKLSTKSPLLGKTLLQIDFRQRYGSVVLAIWRGGRLMKIEMDRLPLQVDDILLVQGEKASINALRENEDFIVSSADEEKIHTLDERLVLIHVPSDSALVGKKLEESRPAESFGISVLGIIREGATHLMPEADEPLQADDMLLVKGNTETMAALQGLQELEIDQQTPDLKEIESSQIGLSEIVLSPHTTLVGKTLHQIHFREKFNLSVLAIWREGNAYRSNLRDMALRFGDALLLYGQRDKLNVLKSEPDFLVLEEDVQEPLRLGKAPIAILVMAGVVLSALLGWLPIAIAAVVGVALMVATGVLDMEEAYRNIDWRAVFLIAGMLPLGIAMEKTGAASFLAEGVVSILGDYGLQALLAGIFILTSLASQVMPNPVVTVLMAPIALSTASNLELSPYALIMVVAIAASASFLSPVGHPANILIMGPGGYRFSDYVKVGLPLTIIILIATLLVLPIFWPLIP
jgi:di/tricarboxylate transporter